LGKFDEGMVDATAFAGTNRPGMYSAKGSMSDLVCYHQSRWGLLVRPLSAVHQKPQAALHSFSADYELTTAATLNLVAACGT
jgi:hypothetical protein